MSKLEILVFICLQKKKRKPTKKQNMADMKNWFHCNRLRFLIRLKMVNLPQFFFFSIFLPFHWSEKYESINGNDRGMWLSSKILQNYHRATSSKWNNNKKKYKICRAVTTTNNNNNNCSIALTVITDHCKQQAINKHIPVCVPCTKCTQATHTLTRLNVKWRLQRIEN